MNRHNTLACATLLAAVFAAPGTALADRPTEEVAFYYNKIAFQYATGASDAPATTPMLTPIDPLPAGGIRRGTWIADVERPTLPAPSSKPKEIVVVGSKLPATPSDTGAAARRGHPDFAWQPAARPPSGAVPASPPVAAPKPQPQPYTLIELLRDNHGYGRR